MIFFWKFYTYAKESILKRTIVNVFLVGLITTLGKNLKTALQEVLCKLKI